MSTTDYDKADLQEAINTMRSGGIILYPTDTVWGIGCDATNSAAVSRIYNLKKRADSKSMLVLTDSPSRILNYVEYVPETAWQLISVTEGTANPRPLTIIYPNAKNLASNLISDDGSIGIRLTVEPYSKALCMGFKLPIVSTSANISGQPTPASFDQISSEIKDGVDYICQYRQNDAPTHSPSSIIKIFPDESIKIIRM